MKDIFPEKLYDLHYDLLFLPERIKTEKVVKFSANNDKKEYVIQHKNFFKKTLNHGLVLKKVHRVIKFNQKVWLKLYIDMKSELRKDAKNDFE